MLVQAASRGTDCETLLDAPLDIDRDLLLLLWLLLLLLSLRFEPGELMS